jgi:hypothetical protein
MGHDQILLSSEFCLSLEIQSSAVNPSYDEFLLEGLSFESSGMKRVTPRILSSPDHVLRGRPTAVCPYPGWPRH